MIVAKGLTKLYGDFVAVDHINFEIKKGEIFGFLGPNGAGKTTTIRMLASIFPPTEGSARVANYDIVEEGMDVRARVGILSENPGLYERLTARANLDFFARLYDVPSNEIKDRIEYLGDIFDLGTRLDEKVGTYSKGMKQKLAIAKALIHDPPVLFLDEPTSALSPESAKAIRDLLIDLATDRSRTICICTHNLFDAERLCDRVAIIRKGQILTIGTPAEISSKFSGPPTIRLLLKSVENGIQQLISKIEGVISIEKHPVKRDLFIKIENHEEQTPEIVRRVVEADGEILEIEPIHASLEEAYLKLIEEDKNTDVKVKEKLIAL
ncbi:MAG TPA: ABC transporter ATP-binding protein [candidate division Zixibacteria bacterium]|nr:ABC transporter ATP-binding protein [candidate division Zixibacteria bacterium]